MDDSIPTIKTDDMMHAAFLMCCGAQFIRLLPQGRKFWFELSIDVLDKRAASKRLKYTAEQVQKLADDLEGKEELRSLRDIVEDSFFSSVYDNFRRLSLRVKTERQKQ